MQVLSHVPFPPHAALSVDKSLKKLFFVFFYYLTMRLSFKFHKDPIFCCRDICTMILTFVQFLMHSAYRVSQKKGGLANAAVLALLQS